MFSKKHCLPIVLNSKFSINPEVAVRYSCNCWASSGVIVTLGAVNVAAGVLLIFPTFWCVEVRSDSGRRDSNPGSGRS